MQRLVSVATVGFAVIVAGFAWFYAGAVRCGDACSATASTWDHAWDSWQWSLIMWLGIALLVLSFATVLAAAAGRLRLATAAVALWAGAAVILCDLIVSSSREVGYSLWLWLALGLVLTGGCPAIARSRLTTTT